MSTNYFRAGNKKGPRLRPSVCGVVGYDAAHIALHITAVCAHGLRGSSFLRVAIRMIAHASQLIAITVFIVSPFTARGGLSVCIQTLGGLR